MITGWKVLLLILEVFCNGASSSPNAATTNGLSSITYPSALLTSIFSPFAPTSERVNNSKCRLQSRFYMEELHGNAQWAVEMKEASTLTAGYYNIWGSIDGGNFDQCLEIQQVFGNHTLSGKHCLATLNFSIPSDFEGTSEFLDYVLHRYGVQAVVDKYDKRSDRDDSTYRYGDRKVFWSFCVPSACSALELQVAVEEKLRDTFGPLGVLTGVQIDESYCLTRLGRKMGAAECIAISCLVLYGFLLIFAAWHEMVPDSQLENPRGKWHRILSSFSVRKHWRNLIVAASTSRSMECLSGLRVLSMFAVSYVHQPIFLIMVPVINHVESLKAYHSFAYILIANFFLYSPDTFLVISGLLVSFSFIKEMAEKGTVSLWRLYLNRYLRLTPLLLAVLLMLSVLSGFLPRGPYGLHILNDSTSDCTQNWWKFLLYVRNYDYSNGFTKCLPHSWTLGADMQLFLLSPLVLYLLWKRPTLGFCSLAAIVALSVGVTFQVAYSKRLPPIPFVIMSEETLDAFANSLYCQTYTRGGPYIVGLVLGYVLYLNKQKPLQLSKVVTISGWILSIAACIYVATFVAVYILPDTKHDALAMGLYIAFNRILWSLAMAWVIFVCVSGCGGTLNAFLSWRGFALLGRLSYPFYLLNFVVMKLRLQHIRTPQHVSELGLTETFVLNAVYTLIVATLFHITVEAPFIDLAHLITKKDKKKKEE